MGWKAELGATLRSGALETTTFTFISIAAIDLYVTLQLFFAVLYDFFFFQFSGFSSKCFNKKKIQNVHKKKELDENLVHDSGLEVERLICRSINWANFWYFDIIVIG